MMKCLDNFRVVSYRNSTSNHNRPPPTGNRRRGCILSKFYIKPQLTEEPHEFEISCILSKFYIKPQHWATVLIEVKGCILSKFYIKPQHLVQGICNSNVVSYRNSTSNHNYGRLMLRLREVVSYRNSTSNHNLRGSSVNGQRLYLIEILHQTTTL